MLNEIMRKNVSEKNAAKIDLYVNNKNIVSNYLLSCKIIKIMTRELEKYSLSEDVDNYLITYTDNLNNNELVRCYNLIKEKGVIKMLTSSNDTKNIYLLKLINS